MKIKDSIEGVGLGLRPSHFAKVFNDLPQVPWFEATSENYFGLSGGFGGRPLVFLREIRKNYPIVLHGVSLSIGSVDPLNLNYLSKLKGLIDEIEPAMVSDHFCWTGVEGENLHDLLPLPYTAEAVKHLCERIDFVQNYLNRELVLENVSSYLTYTHSKMTEWEFISEVSKKTGCGLLLDVNNIYVSSVNHKFDPVDFLNGLPAEKIRYAHLAGFSEQNGFLIDTHSRAVSHPVWDLYKLATEKFGRLPSMIEWDAEIPEFEILLDEVAKATEIQSSFRKREELNGKFGRPQLSL